ncbi:SufE-like protein 1, chloroplastic/mitochondrial [Stylosanthes scabra]|uniref:SufE-like protein 1, chloroplastic/mitochondrial n=1 Tax=Stylosanthes scabra TaxID=79078 RepID=A0ABU6SVP6_9FABA|nr:SufE-like protein 1, chloroplastic/mitochondrial [Stylosanthes scabra]
MSANSISSCSSFRFLTTRTIPKTPFLKTPSFIQIPRKNNDHTFFSFRPITFQKLPTSTTPSPSTTEENPLQPIEELPPKLQEIVKLFQSVEEPKAKYEQLLFYGKNLKPLEQQFKTNDNKVQGCVSQVWVRAYLEPQENNNVVVYEADSDSLLTKGLAALLVTGFSGRPVSEIVRVKPDFVHLLGLQQSLTPSRNNGFLNMLKLMQKKALMLFVEAEKKGASEPGSSSGLGSSFEVKDGSFVENSVSQSSGEKGSSSEVKDGSFVENNSSGGGELSGRGKRIKEKLEKELDPVELEVEDVSYQHAGHAGVRGSGGDGETHFNLRVVSKEFEGKSLVKRHRLIYKLLDDELQSGLHALSIEAKTPSEVNQG